VAPLSTTLTARPSLSYVLVVTGPLKAVVRTLPPASS
jgi:hypothetical protein